MKPFSVVFSFAHLLALATLFPAVLGPLSASAPCIPQPAGLTAWFRFEGDAKDTTGGLVGTPVPSAVFAPGAVGMGVKLDGTGGVSLPLDGRFDRSNFTIECWVKRANLGAASQSTPNDASIFAGGSYSYSLSLKANGQLFLSHVGVESFDFEGRIQDLDWHHVALTREGPVFRLFLDGVPAGQLNLPRNFVTSGTFSIGALSEPFSGYLYAFWGEIDEFSFYSRELSTEEIRSVYEAGTAGKCDQPVVGSPCEGTIPSLVAWYPLDTDARNLVGATVEPGSAVFGPGMVNGAAFFDGRQIGIPLPLEPRLTSQNFTVEAWIRRATLAGSSQSNPADGAIFGGGRNSYAMALNSDGILYLSHLGVQSYFDSNLRIGDLDWHHVAITKSGSIVSFFLDGQPGNQVNLGGLVFDLSTPFAIGSPSTNFGDYNYAFWGGIDELSVFDRALAGNEIRLIWEAGSAGKCRGPLSISMEPPSSEVTVNQPVSYQITVNQYGTNSLENVVVSNSVPASLQVVSVTASVGTVSTSTSPEGSLLVYSVGTLAPSATATLTVNLLPVSVGVNTITAAASATGLDNESLASATIHTIPVCVPVPALLAAWWRGESNSMDAISGRSGAISNGVSFVTGRIGTAFRMDGLAGSGVNLGPLPVLKRSVFSVEGWLRREVSTNGPVPGGAGTILGADSGGWSFSLVDSGALALGRTDLGRVETGPVINDQAWHHVAVTRSEINVDFYVDGQVVATVPYAETFQLDNNYGLGGLFPSGRNAFRGDLDEISFYDRVLSAEEIAGMAGSGGAPRCVNDLVITSTAGGPIALGEDFTAQFVITSLGGDSTAVTFTNGVPPGILLLSATSSQGSIENVAGFLRGNLGTIPAGSNAVVTVVFRPLVDGVYPLVATAGRAEAELTLANNRFEAPLDVRILSVNLTGDVTVGEQAGEPAVAVFEVSLSTISSRTVAVDYSTLDGTAIAGADFEARSGRLEFPPGTLTRTVSVPVAGDGIYELVEEFQLVLTNAVNAVLGNATATGNIGSGDPMPVLRVESVLAAEGNGGPTPFRFRASLDRPAGVEATVNYATTNDTARTPTDFIASTGTLVFAPGETSQTLEITVNGDTSVEANEQFFLNFSGAHYLRFPTQIPTPAVGTIINDDGLTGQVAGFVWETPAGATVGELFAATMTAHDGTGAVVPGFGGVVGVQAFAGPGRPSSVVFTEVAAGVTSGVELRNVSLESLDLSGWSVVLYDATRWPAPRATFVIPDGTVVAAGDVFVVESSFAGSPAGSYPRFRLGLSLAWSDRGSPAEPKAARIGAVLTDPFGQVEDAFFADGADPQAVGVPTLISPEDWTGVPALALLGSNSGYRRVASLNRNSRRASDWEQYRQIVSNLGQPNPGSPATFVDAMPLAVVPPTVAEFAGGKWSGHLTLNGYAPEVRLLADDGNGHRGLSASFPLRVLDDLSVTMTTDSPVLAIPSWSAQFLVSVTNLGPVLSSNVTATVLLGTSYGTGPSVVFEQQVSQGTASWATTVTPGVGAQTKITANFGDLPAAGVATLRFSANKGNGVVPQTLPTNVVSTVSLTRKPVELNLLNNTATVVQEISQQCAPLGESVAGWWRAESGFESVFNGLTATPVGDARLGDGRVGSGGFHFDGVGDAIRVADHDALDFAAGQSFSLELWLRIPSTTQPLIALLGKQQGTGTNSVGYALVVRQGRLQLELGDGTNFETWTLGQAEVRDGIWHHLVVSIPRAGEGNRGAWLDARDVSGPPAQFAVGDLANPAPLKLGEAAESASETSFAGDLDEVVIYRRALTGNEASQAARAGAHGHCTSEVTFQAVRPRFQFVNFEWLALDSGVAGQPYHADFEVRNAGPLPATVATWVYPADPLALLEVRVGAETAVYTTETGVATNSPFAVSAGGSVPLALKLNSTNPVVQLTILPQGGGVTERRERATLRIPLAADTDGDGIPDAIEISAGLNPGSAADASSDTDGDGWTAAQEFEAGTVANDPNSALRLRVVDGQVVFDALASRIYQLERRETVGEIDWVTIRTLRPESNGPLAIGPLLGEDASGYYRVLASQPY